MKKVKKIKSEKIYLKKGYYPLNNIYYDIFLSSNGKHYFSFVNDQGRTVLLNGNIKGFVSLEEAEAVIEQVLVFAQQKDKFEIKTAKDGKFFFNLSNDKGEKIAKSFFFRKNVDIEHSLNEFISGTPSINTGTSATKETIVTKKNTEAEIIPISQNITTTNKEANLLASSNLADATQEDSIKKIQEEKDLADKKWAEEKKKLQLEKEKKAKETEIFLAAKKQKREEAKIKKEKDRLAASELNIKNNPYKEEDMFGGCIRWLWIFLVLILLAILFSYFKGCFGNYNSSLASAEQTEGFVDSLDNNNGIITADSLTQENISDQNNATNNDTPAIDREDSSSDEDNADDGSNASDVNDSNGGDDARAATKKRNNRVKSNGYQNRLTKLANCNCSNKSIVFEIPATDPKIVNRLGTNPQFGNTHGLSAVDFMEELKQSYQTNSWDRSYLNYLYKAMGYSGFQDVQASQFSTEKLKTGALGILGFGSYSGYGYSQLDLKGKDLEVFRIEAANGCHINFMKTCGNLFFTCK